MMLIVSYIFGDLIIFALDFWQAYLKNMMKKKTQNLIIFKYISSL